MEAAIMLNDGKKGHALINLSELMGVSIDTVRRWATGARPLPEGQARAIQAFADNHRLRARLARVAAALEE